jgi:7-carboxy-7-deazaguanine synthase
MYPIAEIFNAPQGEGAHTGKMMTFIRLAGCNVGRPYTTNERDNMQHALPLYTERCVAWSGESFSCDTNYQRSEWLTGEQIAERALCNVCVTGGEPLLHDLTDLARALGNKHVDKLRIHVETSGTRMLAEQPYSFIDWLTVSPKQGYHDQMLNLCDEIKVLVGQRFDEQQFLARFSKHLDKVWLQPINAENELDMANMKRCLAIQEQHPEVCISIQAHKVWKTR